MILAQVPSSSYSAQRRNFVYPQPLDPSWTQVKVTLTRESWPDTGGEIVHFGADLSLDGGQTWQFAGEAGAMGGDLLKGDGTPRTISAFMVTLRNVGDPNRRVRGYINNVVTLTTAVTVEAS